MIIFHASQGGNIFAIFPPLQMCVIATRAWAFSVDCVLRDRSILAKVPDDVRDACTIIDPRVE